MESFIGISIGLSQQAIRVSLTASWSSPHNYLINCQTHANFKSQICDWELLTVFSQQLAQETWGAVFFFGKSKSGFPNPKADLAFFWANPKTDHESIKSTLRVDSSDQIQIRIFEIHNLSVFLGKDLKKVFLTSGFLKKKKGVCNRCRTCMTNWTREDKALSSLEMNLCWWRIINFEPCLSSIQRLLVDCF